MEAFCKSKVVKSKLSRRYLYYTHSTDTLFRLTSKNNKKPQQLTFMVLSLCTKCYLYCLIYPHIQHLQVSRLRMTVTKLCPTSRTLGPDLFLDGGKPSGQSQ